MRYTLRLSEQEAFALLRLAMASASESDEAADEALRKLAALCRSFLTVESRELVPA